MLQWILIVVVLCKCEYFLGGIFIAEIQWQYVDVSLLMKMIYVFLGSTHNI